MTDYVHFLPSLTVGGAPINVLRAIKWLRIHQPENKHVIYAPSDNLVIEEELRNVGAQVIHMPQLKINFRLVIFLFLSLIKIKIGMRKSDKVVLHGRGCGLLIKPIATLLGLQTVHFFRGFTPTYGMQNRFYSKAILLYDSILARFGTCVAVGNDEYEKIQSTLQPTKLIKIRNPVPKIRWELDENAFDFGFVGRRSYQKGFDLALEICLQNPTKRFVWIGAPEKSQYQDAPCPANLTLVAHSSQTEIFSMAKIIVCLSRWEGCSTIITECIKSKKPFLSLYCDGVSEFSIPGLNDCNFHTTPSSLSNSLNYVDLTKSSLVADQIYQEFELELSIEYNMLKWRDF